jgi:K+-sensing histidine kinase KdpD
LDLPPLTARSPKRTFHLVFRFVKRTFALQQIYSITSKSRDAPPAPIEPPAVPDGVLTSVDAGAGSMARSSQLWPAVSGATLHYAVAVLAVAAAVVGGLVADRVLQTAPFVSLFLCAILFAAWLGGAGPGVLAAGLSTLAFDYYFISPADSFAVQVVPRLGLFAMTALFVIWLSVAQRRTEGSLRRARDDLQATVRELEKQNKALQTQDAERSRAGGQRDRLVADERIGL